MRVIVLGYNSFVGAAITSFFEKKNDVELIYVGRKRSDLHDVINFEVKNNLDDLKLDVSSLVKKLKLDSETVIINCISMGDVDKCEVERQECEAQNYHYVKYLYEEICASNYRKLIHFSSNAVYDGEHAPYDEKSLCQPINHYGIVKLKTDKMLLDYADNKVIVIRPITLYGKVPQGGRSNPVAMIIEKLSRGETIKLVDDVFVNILYVDDLVKAVDKLLQIDYSGLINISGDIIYSRYELGVQIASLLGKDKSLISSVTSDEFKTLARRPCNTSFDNTLMKSIGITTTPLNEAIISMSIAD